MVKSLTLRAKAEALADEGLSSRQISLRIPVNHATIARWIKALRTDPNNNVFDPYSKLKARKNNLKCTAENLAVMRRSLGQNPCLTARQIRENNVSLHHLSVTTIKKIMKKKLGYHSRRRSKKPILTPRMIDDRIRFCEAYSHWTEDDWVRVLYSDESTFRVSVKIGSYWVRRPRGSDRFNPRYTLRRNRQEQAVTVWGCFSGQGKGRLVFLPHRAMMNTDRYIPVLEDEVVPTMAAQGCTHYLQVNLFTKIKINCKLLDQTELKKFDKNVVRTKERVTRHVGV